MKITVKSTMNELEDKEVRITAEQVEMLRVVDVIESDEKRFKVHELVADLDTMEFVLWLDAE